MVRTDWDRIFSMNPSSLTDDEIEDLCPTIIHCEVEQIDNVNNLQILMRLSQEILQYKDNQVEALFLECNELKETISSLKPQASRRKKKGEIITDTHGDDEDLKRSSELPDAINYDVSQGKNEKIETLIAELEGLDKENTILKDRLTILKEEMEDATDKMNEMSDELSSCQGRIQEYKGKVLELEHANAALINQIRELTNQQIDRDQVIDEFGAAIDVRISEWKDLLDEKDTEIACLKENLSQYLMQSISSVKEESKSQIAHLNDEVQQREKLINELQNKLSEAVAEINESATLIEKLKNDVKRTSQLDKKKDEKDFFKKLQDANEKICNLQNALDQSQEDLQLKSSELCKVLSTLRKYEDENHGLADALHQVKELKCDSIRKNEHIQDLVNVVNKLEMLNSYQEIEIITLREKLGISEDESISINDTLTKRKEEERKIQEFIKQNKILVDENLEMKSTIRMLKYKLNQSTKKLDSSNNAVETSTEFLHSTKTLDSDPIQTVQFDRTSLYHKTDVNALKQNIQLVIQENEALRTGMHEILDSIRNQDGKGIVEVQSSTLERLLEALDVRHLAGWYHPAMRLQEHLNVVQGTNAELRSQIKQMRKELTKKDNILQRLALNKEIDMNKLYVEEHQNEKIQMYISEINNLQTMHQNEIHEWEKVKNLLIQENNDLKYTIDNLRLQIETFEKNWHVLESGEENDIKTIFAIESRKNIDLTSNISIEKNKTATLQQLLNRESEKIYQYQKEAIAKESAFKKAYADLNKQNQILECDITRIQSNLLNSVSTVAHNELKEKYEELSIRLRPLLENNLISQDSCEINSLKAELELLKQENFQLINHLKKEVDGDNETDLEQQLKDTRTKELLERQRADHMSKLYDISQSQLSKCETKIEEVSTINSTLQKELIAIHKKLSELMEQDQCHESQENKVHTLEDDCEKLKINNKALIRKLEISEQEAQSQYTLNSLKTIELNSLRHQILDLQAVSEDKAIISKLDFELTSRKASELQLNSQKVYLENEISYLQDELEKSQKNCEKMRVSVQDCKKQWNDRYKAYVDVISFLQRQYAGSTSISALDRVTSIIVKLRNDTKNIDLETTKSKKIQDELNFQQDILANRLQIVERLKDILEQQIGGGNVQDMLLQFSENSQHVLNDFKNKRKITHLEYELQTANNKIMEYESTIISMENEMVDVQKAWSQLQESHAVSDRKSIETKSSLVESKSVFVQTMIEYISTEIQTDPYNCCLNNNAQVIDEVLELDKNPTRDYMPDSAQQKPEKLVHETGSNTEQCDNSIILLNEQLNQALRMASERSAIIIKYEAQIIEYKAKIDTLSKDVSDKKLQLREKDNIIEEYKMHPSNISTEGSDKLALKSTINSLQKIVAQKEETVLRYQNLLKEDRDDHSKAANRLQEEITNLHDQLLAMQIEVKRSQENNKSLVDPEKLDSKMNEEQVQEINIKSTAAQEEEFARQREQISTLKADLNITKELSERWHRLAEERLKYMDHMREKLEEQHKNELESYRVELNKWQSEADTLRQRLSDNRVLLTKGNISLMKELQERDDKIHELSLTCQQLQNEMDLMGSTSRSQHIIIPSEYDTKIHEIAHSTSRDQFQQHNQVDVLRRQLQSLMEKEKTYKHEIADLKQRLSHRYMAIKTQEKKASQREIQLEKKVKSLEEELHKTQTQLDREYLAQEIKKAKTAEELSLWEKQKRWQQTAEKLKEKLKEKTDEFVKLNSNYEKLRSVVSCMEREKRFLQSKIKNEDTKFVINSPPRPISAAHRSLVDDLQKECEILRERVKELLDRLENESSDRLLLKIEEQERHIASLEAVAQGNDHVVSKLEKLEKAKDILEKTNLKLESENFELHMKIEKANFDTPRLREKIEHLEKYVELLKVEKSSDSSPRSLNQECYDHSSKKSNSEMERTIFTLKRIIEKLQTENKRLKLTPKKNWLLNNEKLTCIEGTTQKMYEQARKRIVDLETDLQLAEQRVVMLENVQKDNDNADTTVLRQQLQHKTELLEKVKRLLTRAAINEKLLRQRVQQLESKEGLSMIPECHVSTPIIE